MHTGTIIGATTTLLTGVGVGGYFISDYLSERIGARLQGTKVSGDADWEKKIIAVKAKTEKLVDDLSNLTKAEELKNWCNTNYNAKFKDNEDLRFKNIQTYCIYNNKDKLTRPIEANGNWDTVKQSLKAKNPDTDLSSEMKNIRTKLSQSQNPEEDALKNWCLDYYKKVWENNNSKIFTDANEYCVTK